MSLDSGDVQKAYTVPIEDYEDLQAKADKFRADLAACQAENATLRVALKMVADSPSIWSHDAVVKAKETLFSTSLSAAYAERVKTLERMAEGAKLLWVAGRQREGEDIVSETLDVLDSSAVPTGEQK